MIKKNFLITILIINFTSIALGNTVDSIRFILEFNNVTIRPGYDKLVVDLLTDHSYFYFFQENTRFEFILNSSNAIEFSVPNKQATKYFKITFYPASGGVRRPFNEDTWWYLLRNEKEVYAAISAKGIEFKGTYGDFFNCIRDIHSFDQGLPSYIAKDRNSEKQDEYILKYKLFKDSVIDRQMQVLETNRYLFDDTAYTIIKLGCKAKAYFQFLHQLRFNRQGRWDIARRIIQESFISREPSIDFFVTIPYYCDYILAREYFYISYFSERKIEARFHYRKTYDSINKHYAGLLREKLICLYYLYDTRFKNLTSDQLAHSTTIIKSPKYKRILEQIKTSILAGIPAYQFELPNPEGEIVKLADFKNKIIILDFWFKSCLPCQQLAKAMIPIKKKFENNNSVVFINVNVDKDKNTWLTALSDGLYSSSEYEINVHTDGQGIYHPVVKHYNFYGFPHQIVIDGEGKIRVIDPPRPFSEKNKLAFIQLIESLINQSVVQKEFD